MKKQGLLIVIVVLLVIGCSKKEELPLVSEGDNQLKKGRIATTIEFSAVPSGTETWPLEELGGQIMKYGQFSGFFGAYGKINSSLSTYQFAQPVSFYNPYQQNKENCTYNYFLSFLDAAGGATAKIYLAPTGKNSTANSDYCILKIIKDPNLYEWNLWPMKFGPDSYYEEDYFGGNVIGSAIITEGFGKLVNLKDLKFRVGKRPMMYDINLSTGYVKLYFYEIK
jgi:hypothetical protein